MRWLGSRAGVILFVLFGLVFLKFRDHATCHVSCYRQPAHHPLQQPAGEPLRFVVGGSSATMFMHMSSVLLQASGVDSRVLFVLLVCIFCSFGKKL